MADMRITELLDLAAKEGITLPYAPDVIIGLEDRGHYVDLTTGMVGDSNETVSLTPIGEAELIARRSEVSG